MQLIYVGHGHFQTKANLKLQDHVDSDFSVLIDEGEFNQNSWGCQDLFLLIRAIPSKIDINMTITDY